MAPAGRFLNQPVKIAKAKNNFSTNFVLTLLRQKTKSNRITIVPCKILSINGSAISQWLFLTVSYCFGFRSISKPGVMVADWLGIGYELIARLRGGEAEFLTP